MALNLTVQLYRGTLANMLAPLASTGKAGVLAWTTDSDQLFIDTGTAWERVAAGNKVWTPANQAARLALSSALLGDLAVQADTGITYVLTALPASTNGNWTEIGTTSAGTVTSVNSIGPVAGNVSLTLDNIPDGSTYGRELLSVLTESEYDLAKSHQLGHTPDNLIQPSALLTYAHLTAYTEGQCVIDPTNAGKVQQCIVAGTSGASTPAFSATKTVTTPDGATLIWENVGTYLLASVKWLTSATSNEFVTYIGNDGTQHLAQASLAGLSDVNITSITNYDLLQYDSGTSKWLNTNVLDCGTF